MQVLYARKKLVKHNPPLVVKAASKIWNLLIFAKLFLEAFYAF